MVILTRYSTQGTPGALQSRVRQSLSSSKPKYYTRSPSRRPHIEAHSGYLTKKEREEPTRTRWKSTSRASKERLPRKERRSRVRLQLLYVTDLGHPGPGLVYKGTGGASLDTSQRNNLTTVAHSHYQSRAQPPPIIVSHPINNRSDKQE